MHKIHSLKALLALAFLPCALAVAAAEFPIPGKPIKLVVGFPAGGGTDTQARQLGQPLSELLGVPVLVENRPGTGTMLAATEVAKSSTCRTRGRTTSPRTSSPAASTCSSHRRPPPWR